MTDRHHDALSTPEVRAAFGTARDGRASPSWRRAAHAQGAARASDGLPQMLRAKGWHPVWGRYMLVRQDDMLKAVPRQR